jgi:hypothetical protein
MQSPSAPTSSLDDDDDYDLDERTLLASGRDGYVSDESGATGRSIFVLNAVTACCWVLWALFGLTFVVLALHKTSRQQQQLQ